MRLRVASASCQAHHHHALHTLARTHTQKWKRAMSPPYLTVLAPLLSDWLVHRCASYSLLVDEKTKDDEEKGGVKHGNPSAIIFSYKGCPFHFSFISLYSESPGKAKQNLYRLCVKPETISGFQSDEPVSTKRPCEYSVDFSGTVQIWVMSKILSACPQDKCFNSLSFCGHTHSPEAKWRPASGRD